MACLISSMYQVVSEVVMGTLSSASIALMRDMVLADETRMLARSCAVITCVVSGTPSAPDTPSGRSSQEELSALSLS